MPEGRAGLRVWDRLVLLVAWTVTCGFVYLLGVSVGRGTQDLHARPEERIVRLPVNVPAPAAGAPAGVPDEVTFYEKLVTADRTHDRGVEPKGSPAAAIPDATAKAKSPAPSNGATGLMAAARAVGVAVPGAPSAPAAKPAAVVPTTKRAGAVATATPKAIATAPAKVAAIPSRVPAVATPKPPAAAAAKPATAAIANAVVAPDAAPKPATPKAVVPAAAARPDATANAKPPTDPSAAPPKKSWTVTASATPDRYEAQALMNQLKSKGYSAAMVQTAKNGVTQYRVRVGRYGSSTEASDAARKLQREGLQGATPASTD